MATDSVCKLRWFFIIIFLAITLVSGYIYYGVMKNLIPIISVASLFIAVALHGYARYGFKNLLVFFIITWLISNFFEALSIQVGFPFGHYYYDQLLGPRIYQVPIFIMFAYFAMGYTSWMLANILLNQYDKKLSGKSVFFIPLIASFIMVIWDLCMDPSASTISSLWVWIERGAYFGVPIKNYFGWFFVVYLVFQSFALYIARFDIEKECYYGKAFWLESATLYGIQALNQIMAPITQTDHLEIYIPMALITIFTMVFTALLSGIKIHFDLKR